MLLTNGGGVREAERVADLSTRLRLRHPISEEQFVQSHTPFKLLRKTAPELKTVLALGGKEENVRDAAHHYGFKNVVIPADFLKSYPGISPFSSKAHYNNVGTVLQTPPKIDAVLVFNDPRDWALDIQVVIDLLLSDKGQVGTRRPVDQVLKEGYIPIYFSNPDLWWANEYPHSRLGQGGFRAALEGVWRAVTGGKELEATTIGKPHQPTYEYAEDVLTKWRQRKLKKSHADSEHPELKTVYMVGDNPASDIAGANSYKSPRGTEWMSVLVRTGVFKEGEGHSDGNAKAVVDNVEEAVRWAVERERERLLQNVE
jgi:HAD superfamily hydrolase (TIGR01456 family)